MASERSNGRPAAIKIFHRLDGRILLRLERRLQANAELSHPCIVPVHGIGRTTDGRLYYSMPLLTSFEQARHDLLGRPLRIAALLHGLLEGLAHAHRCGTVHGGIKPSNVLFDKQGYAQLTDFGIACGMAEPGLPPPERGRYLSPEQAEGKAPDPRSDLYSIGMLAYELLAGASSIQKNQADRPLGGHAGQAVPRLPPRAAAWQPWMDRALAASPDRRFQTAEEMAGALTSAIGSRGLDGDDPATENIPARRAPKWWPYAAVLAAAIVMLIGWAVSGHRRAPVIVAATPAAAASVDDPALAMSSGQPAPALPAMPDSGSLLADRVHGLIATADTLRANGHLFSPPFQNAASHYLAALAFDPGNPDATAGIEAMLATLRNQLDASWRNASDPTQATGMLRRGDELAEHARAPARQAWRWYHARLARQVGEAVVRAARAHDARKVSALEPLAKTLPAKFPDGFDLAEAQRMASAKIASPAEARAPERQPMRDPHGPQLVYVPATNGAPAFAIARNDITRADYAAFARATHRPASKCLEAHNPFSRLQHLTWQSPGFAQDGDHPVVCVSWDDATAYAAWLSNKTGQHYRLASSGQWLRAARGMPKGSPCKLGNVDDVSRRGRFDTDRWSCDDGAAETAPVGRYAASAVGAYGMYGNVSEWVAGGSPGSRPFRGVSWRDGSHESALGRHGTADSDVGYNSVGFRVMRVIDSVHPAPMVASGG